MPPDFEPWLPYLGRADLEAPVALAACDQTQLVSFYPLADFSPETCAAIRWAAARTRVRVIPCDLNQPVRDVAASTDCTSPATANSMTTCTSRSAPPPRVPRLGRALGEARSRRRPHCCRFVARGDTQAALLLRLDGSALVAGPFRRSTLIAKRRDASPRSRRPCRNSPPPSSARFHAAALLAGAAALVAAGSG